MGEAVAQERRSQTRVWVSVSRKIAIRQSNGTFVHAELCDLSTDGLGIKCPAKARVDKVFELHFSLPNGKRLVRVKARAKVRFCNLMAGSNMFRIGFQFVDIDEEASDAIMQYIGKRQQVQDTI